MLERSCMEKMYEEMLQEFHLKYGHWLEGEPTTAIPNAVRELRIRLMDEELKETTEAMLNRDLVEIADGLADLVYVALGTAVSYGIPFDRVFREVHRSNMTKTPPVTTNPGSGEKYGTKTPKGPDFTPPDLSFLMEGTGTL